MHSAIIWFLIVYLIALLAYYVAFKLSGDSVLGKQVFWIVIIIGSIISIAFDHHINHAIRAPLNLHHVLLILGIIALFIVNNLFQKHMLGMDFDYQIHQLYYYVGGFVLSSTAEELMYRGYLQRKIDYNQSMNKKLSSGILWSSILMTLTHLGFFYAMPFWAAFTAIIAVFLFSIAMGFIMRETNNLLYPIVLHILVNCCHLAIQLYF